MFTATKLRRGMIPKDKEGECWTLSHGGRAMCHHFLFLTTTLVIPLLVGATFCWRKDHYAHTLSTTHLLACPLSRSWLFTHLHVDRVKRIQNSLLGGSVLLFLTRLLACEHVRFSSASQIGWLGDRFFPLFTQSFVSFSTIVRLHNGSVISIAESWL